MSLNIETVRGIAHLARLTVEEAELETHAQTLSRCLDLLAQINAADTTAIAEMAHPLDLAQRLRPDEVTEPDMRETCLAQAPAAESGLFLVPKVIE
ncbi:Asp-tRNA(Asn)/Glu-tRNA(Gln) amidotransferase subunit GatC [Candidatus Macondimonas diazotrophica]|jgi:aspartyl-tRNA(Asn)/glutamyl-tRNA(Gln) amidotransferase subunit C|uniref:Aspartyl/glutamyl-tRNA(Asn/Gln) amidotransferase subunit C n=1 Tax=Candidatus Macondimonas diazotrophica TaxID=2305248 RepID=A0A4Z0FBC2_9GAMM|nr:Asp-tRNA(Asn)/Glu-tRNA(Gln) amidotransferase subunit GatC [Candidatus Macondimonas diazotrophica]NCU01507.1 Asp-tRNA(Asn)/Glu-tRNA(Gln) amidotransferase subunit GatC [Candidatus Macondimonas diazotrophica]TFZ83103.1 Asp-tRNA(Asn)/Glu-tRNA(Gln) amidotransferase subunit GatC [Candidatus Macondimonas diazotrophica]HBG29647.1 Asp-tRNA(Asn)/Glu-tRNA(Gln) amidotransferase GatCAB subunit C [Gammaproteobacteria bacterium]HBG50430.1 Asp-tRNA(Asn)/Glu-tRNA(Gln) amidotransferase GatCAB subunit C [Gamma